MQKFISSMQYKITTPHFEGPFDLLLFFIQRDELDIYDIPIAKITDDFLNYIRELESLNIEMASEFILVAATLIRIKARVLIPRKEVDEEGNEIDPRDELVAQLLEYKRYKSVLDEMRILEKDRSSKLERGNLNGEIKQLAEKALVDVELESLTLFKLMKSFERVMTRFEAEKNKIVHRIVRYAYTVKDQKSNILNKVKVHKKADFSQLFEHCENRIHAIITFLALLELLNAQHVHIINGLGKNNFWIENKHSN